MSSIASKDPSDIFLTIKKIQDLKFITNIIHLSGKTKICEYICQKTDGIYEVPQNESKLIKNFNFLNIYIKDEFKKCL